MEKSWDPLSYRLIDNMASMDLAGGCSLALARVVVVWHGPSKSIPSHAQQLLQLGFEVGDLQKGLGHAISSRTCAARLRTLPGARLVPERPLFIICGLSLARQMKCSFHDSWPKKNGSP
jgi:hypothetical protein